MSSIQHHTEYAPPILRAPSPASSVGTAYAPDFTSHSDSENRLSHSLFEQEILANLQMDKPKQAEEMILSKPILLPRPESEQERNALYEKVMHSLRQEVSLIEENELFEQMILRGSQVAQEPLPSSDDINVIMQSMMKLPAGDGSHPQRQRYG